MPQRVLALEVQSHEVRAALIEASFRDYRIVGLHKLPLSSTDTLEGKLRNFLAEISFSPHTVVSSLPGEVVTLRTFFLPFKDRKRLEQTVPYELETQVPFDLDEVVIAYQVLAKEKNGSNVLAALVPRGELEGHLQALQAAGLDPKIVDFAPLASLNVLQLLDAPLPSHAVFVGGEIDRLAVAIHRGGTLVGLRTITPPEVTREQHPSSDNGHLDVLQNTINDIVAELRWTLFALNGGPLDEGTTCVLVGEGIYFDLLSRELQDQLGLVVNRIQESPLKGLPSTLRDQIAGFAAPIGLALREIQPDRCYGLNFRRGEFAYHRGQEELRRALWGTASLGALAVGLFVLQTYLNYRFLEAQLAAINSQIRYVFRQTLPDVQRIVDEGRQIKEEIVAAERRLKLLGSVAPPSGATAIDALHAISTAVPEHLKLEVDEYVMDTEEIKIRAHTDSLDTPNAIREAIANGKYFADVQVKDIKTAPDGRVDFRMILTLNKAGSPASSRSPGRI
ncbi:MAG: pilus assembly protein PilM [Candidatus Binatia bacterium]|nr:pilus assembly protein PilM [Candidatus Binatia bacterium]